MFEPAVIPRLRWCAAAIALMLGCPAALLASAADEPAATGDVRLLLRNGGGADIDVLVDLTMNGGELGQRAWAHAKWFNHAQHPGRVRDVQVREEGLSLALELSLQGDGREPGGAATFELSLARNGDAFSGEYRGEFLERTVAGEVTGRLVSPRVRPVAGHVPVAEGEYPRLILRARDLPLLKQRMQTPEGEAIMAMLTRRAPARSLEVVDDRRASWLAVNEAVAYHLLDDEQAPRRARRILIDEVVRKPMPADRADIHHAMRLLGVALTYDLCRDAWDPAFRALMAGYLRAAMVALHEGIHDGVAMTDIAPQPWTHRNAIRMAAIGCAALVLEGERGPDGELIEEAPILAELAEQAVIAWLELGVGPSGESVEGRFYKSFALSNGVLAFMHALRTAAGRDLSRVNPMLLSGHLFDASAAEPQRGPRAFGLSSISVQLSGRWPMGFSSIPPEHVPMMKWAFDHSAGPHGAGHFDCTYPFQAAYALLNYPFDAPAEPPGTAFGGTLLATVLSTGEPGNEPARAIVMRDGDGGAEGAEGGLPAVVVDPVIGRLQLRDRWQDGDDATVLLHLGGVHRGGARDHATAAGTLRIGALGREWIDQAIGIPAANAALGAVIEHADSPRPGQAIVRARLDPLYRSDATPRRRRIPRGEQWPGAPDVPPEVLAEPDVERLRHVDGVYRPARIRGVRHVAVDLTGRSGAAVLVAILDQFEGAADEPWRFNPSGIRFRGTAFSIDGEDDEQLTGRILLPASPSIRRGTVTGGDTRLVVFTIQRGPAPGIEHGEAPLDGPITIGEQVLRFDGERPIFEH